MIKRRLLEFGVICLVLTWVPWGVLGVLGVNLDEGAGSLVFALAASGPSLAALVMWLRYRERRRVVRWTPVWPVAAVGLGAVAPLAASALMGDLPALPDHAASVVSGAGGVLGAAAYTFLAGPVAEEFGWRGYVQPRLRAYFGPLGTTVILGAAWGVWHLPLFFTEWGGWPHVSWVSPVEFVACCVPLSLVMTWVFNRTRESLPLVMLLHASINTTYSLVWPEVFPTLDPTRATLHAQLIAGTAVALLLIVATRGRLGLRTAPPATVVDHVRPVGALSR